MSNVNSQKCYASITHTHTHTHTLTDYSNLALPPHAARLKNVNNQLRSKIKKTKSDVYVSYIGIPNNNFNKTK